MVFTNEENSIPQLLDKTKLHYFLWLKAKFPSFTLVHHSVAKESLYQYYSKRNIIDTHSNIPTHSL